MTLINITKVISKQTNQFMTRAGSFLVGAGIASYFVYGKILPERTVQFVNDPIFPIVFLVVYIIVIFSEIFIIQKESQLQS